MTTIILKKQALAEGLIKYFTGKPCKQGHISERYTQKSTCCECLRLSTISRADKRKQAEFEKYHSRTEQQKEADRKTARENAKKRYERNPEKYRTIALEARNKDIPKALKRLAKYREENREALLQRRREQYAKNPEKDIKRQRAWYKENSEKAKGFARVHRSKNFIYYAKLAKERAALIRKATPKWANQKAIDAVYMNRPDAMQVDHIVPIRSKLVCGLHVANNLQYLTPQQNIAKGNRIWPDMP